MATATLDRPTAGPPAPESEVVSGQAADQAYARIITARMSHALHGRIREAAHKRRQSMNTFVLEAIEVWLETVENDESEAARQTPAA